LMSFSFLYLFVRSCGEQKDAGKWPVYLCHDRVQRDILSNYNAERVYIKFSGKSVLGIGIKMVLSVTMEN